MGNHGKCKEEGCPKLALSTRGTYAYLCNEHKQKKRLSLGLAPNETPFPKLKVVAQKLVKVAERVDESVYQHHLSRNQLIQDIRYMDSIMGELRSTLQTIIKDKG